MVKNKKSIQKEFEYNKSFEVSKGRFKMTNFKECMWAIALKKVLEHYSSEKDIINYLETQLKDRSENFKMNKSNLRGGADAFEIQAFLWVLEKEYDDYFDLKENFKKEEIKA